MPLRRRSLYILDRWAVSGIYEPLTAPGIMPLCIEKKILLSGGIHSYACELLYFAPGFGILRYVIDREYRVGAFSLRPGDLTYALYWENRPYTLYQWHMRQSREVANYFNIADRVSLSPREFVWRDLVIDVLVDAHERVHVLDEDELPSGLEEGLARYIDASKMEILDRHRDIIEEANGLLLGKGLLRA